MAKYARLSGNVLGHLEKRYTRPIQVDQVYLIIQIIDEHKKTHLYNPLLEGDLNRLQKEYSDVFEVVKQHYRFFQPQRADNEEAKFTFESVPIGAWNYIVASSVGKGVDITQEMGNNGFGEAKEIDGRMLEENPNLENIVVPVKDEWWRDNFPTPKADDPKMIPTRDFHPGVIFR